MAQPSDLFDSYDAVGNREDLSNIIYNISPIETPFMSMIPKAKCRATYSEWQIDSLAAVDLTNAHIEGDEATNEAVDPTTRPGNRTQISRKVLQVSNTQEAVSKAGRKKEMAYQIVKRGKELKRDIEAILTQNQATVAGNATTARKTGSLEAWLETNESRGAGGSAGGYNSGTNIVDAATDGTQRALTESMFKDVVSDAWTNGGDPSIVMCGPVSKRNISAWTGNATRTDKSEDMKLTASISVYVSDFGTHRIVPNRFSRDRTVFVLTKNLWALAYLRPFKVQQLAITGDSIRKMLVVEYMLCSKNEAGSGVVADLTTS